MRKLRFNSKTEKLQKSCKKRNQKLLVKLEPKKFANAGLLKLNLCRVRFTQKSILKD